MTHQAFTLEKHSVTRVDADGRQGRTVFLECRAFVVIGDSVDFRITKADGSVVRDTRKERVDRNRKFRDVCGRLLMSDILLGKLMESYEGAVNDTEDELIYLYEVRDALSTHFKSSDKARMKLGIPKKKWNRLGEMANTMPLRQGRHRGEHDELRDATAEELEEARGLAREFIEAYVRRAENQEAMPVER